MFLEPMRIQPAPDHLKDIAGKAMGAKDINNNSKCKLLSQLLEALFPTRKMARPIRPNLQVHNCTSKWSESSWKDNCRPNLDQCEELSETSSAVVLAAAAIQYWLLTKRTCSSEPPTKVSWYTYNMHGLAPSCSQVRHFSVRWCCAQRLRPWIPKLPPSATAGSLADAKKERPRSYTD